MKRRQVLSGALAAVIAGAAAGTGWAQPSRAPLQHGILDTGAESYTARQFSLPGPQGAPEPGYLVTVLIPAGQAPEAGFPVLYALDGKAVVERLGADVLDALPKGERPVIVAIGYDTDARFAGAERSRDYTPPLSGGAVQQDGRGRPTGGFAPFYDRVVGEILPQAEALAPVDPARRTLWGHSYGGLFVLQAAMRPAPQPFAAFVAASPSLWWDEGRYLAGLREALSEGGHPSARLDLQVGSDEGRRSRAALPPGQPEGAGRGMPPGAAPADKRPGGARRHALPDGALTELEAQLKAAGNAGNLTVFPGLSHGETFPRSLLLTVRGISAERER